MGCSENPAIGTKGKCTFSNEDGNWVEEFDLLDLLCQSLEEKQIKYSRTDDSIITEQITLIPGIVEIHPLENGVVRTVSTIEFSCEAKGVDCIFEYQHATGCDISSSLRTGFEYWIDSDLEVIVDALLRKGERCNTMIIENPTGLRKIIHFGNPLRLAKSTDLDDANHPFCPCCMFTNSFPAFEDLFRNRGFYALRLLISRDNEGAISADCRLNGIDHELGKAALCEYGEKWPNQGVEMRKQYIILMDDTD